MRYSISNAIPHNPKSEKHPYENLVKQGVSGQKGVNNNYDKSPFHLPRQSIIKSRKASKNELLNIL